MLQDESETFITEKQGYLPLRLTKLGFEEVGMTLQLTPITSNITFTGAFKFYILGKALPDWMTPPVFREAPLVGWHGP